MKRLTTSFLRRRAGIAIAALVLLVGACRSTAPPSSTASAEDVLHALIAADNAGDLAAIAGSYAEDAVLLPPDGPPTVGRASVRQSYEQGFAAFRLRVRLRQEDFRSSGSLAYSRGTTEGEYVWRDGSPPTPFHDAYLMVLARDAAGDWKVSVLMWSPVSPDSE